MPKNEKRRPHTDSIAILTLYSYNGDSESKHFIRSYGHAFVSIENISDMALELMHGVKVASHETITFSWWATDRHMGIWFNIEPNYIKLFGKYTGRISISRYIDMAHLDAIQEYLARNDRYTPISNCAKNCSALWDLCEDKGDRVFTKRFQTPKKLYDRIRKLHGFEFDRPVNDQGEIFFVSREKTNLFEMEKKDDKEDNIYIISGSADVFDL